MTRSLHIVRLVLDRRALMRLAARHHLPASVDEGYLLHAGLSQLFARTSDPADVPLHVFALDDTLPEAMRDPGCIYALGYASEGDDALRRSMGPAHREILRICKSNSIPSFEQGQRLGFRTRLCPVVRTRTPGTRALGTDRRGKVKPRELDAFVHATLGIPRETKVSREEVYIDWLKRQFEEHPGCTLLDARLAQFRREVMHRRGGSTIERPNAVIEGTLTVTDPALFDALLRRGIGRHRAFGFGMLLLRPPSTR